jgi:hypothetical protein
MSPTDAAWPLAFILAMGAQSAEGKLLDLEGAQRMLTPGVLAELADLGVGAEASSPSLDKFKRLLVRDRIVQFFPNFRNCVTGSWKNC